MTVVYLTEFRFYQQHSELFGYTMDGHLMFLRFPFTKSIEQTPLWFCEFPRNWTHMTSQSESRNSDKPSDEVASSPKWNISVLLYKCVWTQLDPLDKAYIKKWKIGHVNLCFTAYEIYMHNTQKLNLRFLAFPEPYKTNMWKPKLNLIRSYTFKQKTIFGELATMNTNEDKSGSTDIRQQYTCLLHHIVFGKKMFLSSKAHDLKSLDLILRAATGC